MSDDIWIGADAELWIGAPPACSHRWMNPTDAPIARAAYSPVIGPRRREMTPATDYRCINCGAVLRTPPAPEAP